MTAGERRHDDEACFGVQGRARVTAQGQARIAFVVTAAEPSKSYSRRGCVLLLMCTRVSDLSAHLPSLAVPWQSTLCLAQAGRHASFVLRAHCSKCGEDKLCQRQRYSSTRGSNVTAIQANAVPKAAQRVICFALATDRLRTSGTACRSSLHEQCLRLTFLVEFGLTTLLSVSSTPCFRCRLLIAWRLQWY